jgi:hypothetical protein
MVIVPLIVSGPVTIKLKYVSSALATVANMVKQNSNESRFSICASIESPGRHARDFLSGSTNRTVGVYRIPES